MPRPKRPGWSRITITVSDEVSRHIRVRAAELGIEMGTFVNEAVQALLRAPPPPTGHPVPEAEPGFRSGRAPLKAGPPVLREAAGRPAGTAGTDPAGLAEFVYQQAIASPGSRVFSPLRHLQVAARLTANSLSAAMFRCFIASAWANAGREGAGVTDPGTLRFLDAVLQTLDRFFQELQIAFPIDESRVALWSPDSAAAFGTIIGRRLGQAFDGTDPEGSAQRVAASVSGMVKNLARVNPNAPELLGRDASAHLVSLLMLHETPPTKRGSDGDASDAGYGYFT